METPHPIYYFQQNIQSVVEKKDNTSDKVNVLIDDSVPIDD